MQRFSSLPAGAWRGVAEGQDELGGADLLELGLFARVQEDHGKGEVKGDPQPVHHLLAQVFAGEEQRDGRGKETERRGEERARRRGEDKWRKQNPMS